MAKKRHYRNEFPGLAWDRIEACQVALFTLLMRSRIMTQQFYATYMKKYIHTACIEIGETQHENLQISPFPWYCPYCITDFPFSSINNKDLHSLASGPTIINNHASPTLKQINKKTKGFLKKFRKMYQIFHQSDNLITCDYYDIPEFKKMKITEQQNLSILPLNISSISAHINDLKLFLILLTKRLI